MMLAIELISGWGAEDVRTVRQLCEAARRLGHEVELFLMDDGVYNLERLQDLAAQGVSIVVCAHNAYQRGVSKREGVLFGGQNDWAEMVNRAHRTLAFG